MEHVTIAAQSCPMAAADAERLADQTRDHICDVCWGSGEVRWNPSPVNDPQAELDAECSRCGGTGAV